MSERYAKLFALPENLYASGSPVIIAAGALLKDNQTGKVLAQLKLRNIGTKSIKAAKVCVCPLDTVGNSLGAEIEYQYLDLNADRNGEFAAKSPIFLPDAATRSFSAFVTEVIFADNSVWKATGSPWEILSVPATLEEVLKDQELVKQYRMKFGADSKYEPNAQKDVWYCTCGELNREEETVCHRCRKMASALLSVDMEALKKDRDDRVANERQKAAEEKAVADAKAKKNKKLAMIITPIVVGLFIAIVLISGFVKKQEETARFNAYNAAVEMAENGQYDEAIKAFEELAGYQDSETKIEECQFAIRDEKYENALMLMSTGKYEEAIAIFSEIESHKDSGSKIVECNTAIQNEQQYNNALSLMGEGKYEEAMAIFAQLGEYKDSYEHGLFCFEQNNLEAIRTAQAGDSIYFGVYEQDNDLSAIEYIEWLVLDRKDDKLFVLSKNVLDNIPIDTSGSATTWETSAVRKWLNNDFLDNYFTNEEKAAIPTVPVVADKVVAYTEDPGNDTQDRVFLLSHSEVELYFGSKWEYEAKLCYPTSYAVANGVRAFDSGTCYWWLRTSAHSSYFMAVTQTGLIHRSGEKADTSGIGLRPAMWIDLNALKIS